MAKYIKICIILLILATLEPFHPTQAAAVKINDLIEGAISMDGKKVTVTAEAIGEKMDREGGTWVNVHDGSNAIGIWMTKEEAERISVFGNYKQKGDTLEVTGLFNRACKEHGGEADIHLLTMKILKTGEAVEKSISMVKTASSVVLLSLMALLYLAFRNQSRYSK